MAAVSSLIAFITTLHYLIVYILYEETTSDSDSNQPMGMVGPLDPTRLSEEWWNGGGRTTVTANVLTAALDHSVHHTVVRTRSHSASTILVHEQHSSDVTEIQQGQVTSASKRISAALNQLDTNNVEQNPKMTTANELHSAVGNHPVGKSQAVVPPTVVEIKDGPSKTLEADSKEPHEYFKRYLRLRELRKRRGSTLEPEHPHLEDIQLPSQPQPRVHSIDDSDRQRDPSLRRTRIAVNRPEDKSMKSTKVNAQIYFTELCQEKIEPLVECSGRVPRILTPFEQDGKNIMFTLRTTLAYHKQRLPLLFETWLTTVTPSTVFIVTDGHHTEMEEEIRNRGISITEILTTSLIDYVVSLQGCIT